jgi:hypothetical protein
MPRDNDGTLPVNHGKPWSYGDEDLLLKKLSDGESIKDISDYFKRTEGGISSRQRELAYRFVEEGKTIEEASKFTRVAVEDIERSLALRKLAAKSISKTVKKEETLMSVVIEIRDLLKQLLKKDSNSDDDVQTVTTESTYGLS